MVRQHSITAIAMALLIGASVSAQGKTGSIRGVINDNDFDTPLADVKVTTVKGGKVSRSTSQGSYVLKGLAPGKYTLVFFKDGYVRQIRSDVVVSAGKLTDLDLSLAGDFTDMDEFVVAKRLTPDQGSEAGLLQLRFESPSLMDSVSADMMSRAGVSDAAGALRLVAGATVRDGKAAVIRGLPDRYVSSQMNGVRLPTADENKRAVELDQFPAAVIDSIRVTKTFTPDQQGDASGGAVDVRLKGIPDKPFLFKIKGQASRNSQVTGRSDFLSYEGGGVSQWAKDDGRRDIQYDNIGSNWGGAAGVSRSEAPVDYKWSSAIGGSHEFGNGVKVGGFASLFYERDSSFYDHGQDNSYWVERPGAPMTPKTSQGTVQEGDFKTSLFDVTQGSQSVQWGGLGTVGLATENNSINLLYLFSRTAEDKATLAEDTRGKSHFFPGHNPSNQSTPGHDQPDAAPYLRLETLEYTERTTSTLQLNGRHTLPVKKIGIFKSPELDWTVARSKAGMNQPDKRQFGSAWYPERQVGPPSLGLKIPATHQQFKPAANFTLGNLQRIWKEIEEESDQYSVNLKLPFDQWSGEEGYLKVGYFHDDLHRDFHQESFSNFNDNSSFEGPHKQFWSGSFGFEDHPISESLFDVDYSADQEITAWYAMFDIPLASNFSFYGGARFESTNLTIENSPEENATWLPPGAASQTKLNPGDADVAFDQDDVLPALGLVYHPFESITLRASYSETVARQTFKELTPILQQEFLGGPIFVGNPELEMSALKNYDLRLDFTPVEGSLYSVSWFRKDIEDPIEYVQKVGSFDFTTAENYPEGRITGWELEARQELGSLWSVLDGIMLGANATFIDSEVTLPEDEALGFEHPSIQAPMRSRDMTNAPDHLFNLYMTYGIKATGTQMGLFYNVQGDTLIAGAGQASGNFVPSIYAKEFDTLNFSLTQRVGTNTSIQFRAKNLTNPDISEVYRSEYIGGDVLKSTHTKGIEYSISIGGEFTF